MTSLLNQKKSFVLQSFSNDQINPLLLLSSNSAGHAYLCWQGRSALLQPVACRTGLDQAEQAIKLPMRKTAYAQDRIGHRLPMRKTELVTEKEKGKISAVCAEVTYAKVKFFFFDIIKLKVCCHWQKVFIFFSIMSNTFLTIITQLSYI